MEKEKINLIIAASVIGSTLSGSTQMPNKEEDKNSNSPANESALVENLSKSPEYMKEFQEAPTYRHEQKEFKNEVINTETFANHNLESIGETKYEKELQKTPTYIYEQKEFNNEVINTETWANYNLESIEKMNPGYGVTLTKETPMLLIPFKNDFFIDNKRELKEIIIPKNNNFEIAEKRTLIGQNGEKVEIGLISNTYGAEYVGAVLLKAEDENGVSIEFSEQQTTSEVVTYIGEQNSIYPNKVINILKAVENISKFQDENGQFKNGTTYSFLDLAGLNNPSKLRDYEYGLTSTKAEVKAGGVCAVATGISSLIHQQKNEKYITTEQWDHPILISQGPFSPSKYQVDATVDLAENGPHDFKWVQGEDKYLKIQANIIPSDIPFEETDPNGLEKPSDVILILSLSFTSEKPQNQTEQLSAILNQYLLYRESQHQIPLHPNQEVNVVSSKIDGEVKNSINQIYSPENLFTFKNEIVNNKSIQDIFDLQYAVNSYPTDSDVLFSTYLKQTQWYKNYIKDKDRGFVNQLIGQSTTVNIEGQPLQCVGFVILASRLYPDLNIPDIGGAPITTARELIPTQLVDNKYEEIAKAYTNYGTLALAGPLQLKDYQAGDLFVTTTGGISKITQKPFGHVGVILAKVVNNDGTTSLIVADSNRHNDGRIKIFEVNEKNLENIFGAEQRYIIRKYKQ